MSYFLAAHVILTVLMGMYFLQKDDCGAQYLAPWLMIAVLPIGGLLIYWSLFCYRPQGVKDENQESDDDYSEKWPAFSVIEPISVASEIDIAPLEDTLLIADYGTRREVVMKLLKEDAASRARFITLALQNEDSETAHYAASGILNTKRKLDSSLSEFSALYQANPSNLSVAFAYADLLHQYRTTVYLDPVDRRNFAHESADVLEKIVNESEQLVTIHLSRLIDVLLEIQDFRRTSSYCKKFLYEYPDSEEKFLVLLKSYFMMKDKEHFEFVFRRFRDSDVHFSSETMHIIRLWLNSVTSDKNSN